jgi:hypothetical protein
MIARRERKSFDRSLLWRSARLTQHKVLKDFGIIRDDWKLDEDASRLRLFEGIGATRPNQVNNAF